MEQPHTLADALEALTSARADVAALEALSAEHSQLVTAFAGLNETHNALQLSLAASLEQNATLTAALEALKAEQKTASAQANATLSNLGIDPVAVVPETANAEKTSAELWAEYNTLGFQARNEFYKLHKAKMQLKR
jgi:seryl-tRNA synthetase